MSAGSQPDFYMGMLEGALRVMPAWQWVVFGHTFAFNVFIPALVPLGLVFTRRRSLAVPGAVDHRRPA